MSKKKAPALHERRGREDISTRPPRLAGYPIKLAGDARLRRLSLAADSCVNRKYYGGDPGVGQRKTWLHTIPPSGRAAEGRAQGFRSVRSWARSESTLSAFRLVRNLRKTYPPRPARSCGDLLAAKIASWRLDTLAEFIERRTLLVDEGRPSVFGYFGTVVAFLFRVCPGYAGTGFGDQRYA